MLISLRKANAIQVAINEALKGLEFKAEISINEFQNPEEAIASANNTFFTNVSRRTNLLKALYEVRKATSAMNAAGLIDSRLADIAFLEKEVTFYSAYAKTQERIPAGVINGKIGKIRNRTEDNFYAKAEVETSIFTQDDIKTLNRLVVKAKKEKQKLQDELLELNVRTTITLSDETIATLTNEDIL
jgi:hypothetical protein